VTSYNSVAVTDVSEEHTTPFIYRHRNAGHMRGVKTINRSKMWQNSDTPGNDSKLTVKNYIQEKIVAT
jgi:hypothetical protein